MGLEPVRWSMKAGTDVECHFLASYDGGELFAALILCFYFLFSF
jgi:hypothetical protein